MKRLFVLALPLIFLLSGCNPYGTAAKLAQDIAVSDGQAVATVDQLRAGGSITVQEERGIIGWLDSVNTLNGTYLSCVVAAHNQSTAGGFTACAQTLVAALGQPGTLQALRISNQAKQAEITAIGDGLVALASGTIAALGGK